jgi:CBS domain-containing protein
MPPADGPKGRTVADIMSSPVVTASPGETIADAAGRMREKHVGSVVVVEAECPVGILTERDLVFIGAAGADTSAAMVAEWMTADPDSVSPDLDGLEGVVVAETTIGDAHDRRRVVPPVRRQAPDTRAAGGAHRRAPPTS